VSRAEASANMVRGILSRLIEDPGFNPWVPRSVLG